MEYNYVPVLNYLFRIYFSTNEGTVKDEYLEAYLVMFHTIPTCFMESRKALHITIKLVTYLCYSISVQDTIPSSRMKRV
jgi:hypothetical protein